jgi:hypothetical protein
MITKFICDIRDRAYHRDWAFAQTYTINRAIQKWGIMGTQVTFEEVNQLHQRNCFEPVKIEELMEKKRKKH